MLSSAAFTSGVPFNKCETVGDATCFECSLSTSSDSRNQSNSRRTTKRSTGDGIWSSPDAILASSSDALETMKSVRKAVHASAARPSNGS